MTQGRVIWIMGLSGAGKSSLAAAVANRLRAQGRPIIILDGDELREVFAMAEEQPWAHTRESRLALAMRYSRLCRMRALQGLTIVIATISMLREVHAFNRVELPERESLVRRP